MGKLSILGAQRVKALTEILNKKEKEQIRELQDNRRTEKSINEQVDAEYGVDEVKETIDRATKELNGALDAMYEITGEPKKVNITSDYNKKRITTEYIKRKKQINDEANEEINKIKEEYSDKRSRLWLCETLEEAKEIVGIR